MHNIFLVLMLKFPHKEIVTKVTQKPAQRVFGVDGVRVEQINKNYIISSSLHTAVSIGYPEKLSIECVCDSCKTEFVTQAKNLFKRKSFDGGLCKSCSNALKIGAWYSSADGKDFTKERGMARSIALTTVGPLRDEFIKQRPRGANHKNFNPLLEDQKRYSATVRSIQTKKFGTQIKNLDNHEKRGMNGVSGAYQLDHKYSIDEGFKNKVSPEILSHICNLEYIPWSENIKKKTKCSVSIEQLIQDINEYELINL